MCLEMMRAQVRVAECLLTNPAARVDAAGDTFTKTFQIKGIRNTSNKERSTYDFTCRLVNQRGKVCMECDRTTMFPFFVPASSVSPDHSKTGDGGANGVAGVQADKAVDSLRDHVIKQSEKLGESTSSVDLLRQDLEGKTSSRAF